MKIILGSQSPRRRELLSQLGYEFRVVVSNTVEVENGLSPEELAYNNALNKAKQIAANNSECLVICADTIVVCNDTILGKPKSSLHAKMMIQLLQNNVHKVITAVVCIYKNIIKSFTEETKVFVVEMSESEIDAYVSTNEPYDKSGSYAIQGAFSKFISRIEGDFYNVMGLPLSQVYRLIKEFELNNYIK